MVVRPRTDADLDSCERLALAVQRRDGYPPIPPGCDLRAFLASPDVVEAWVAASAGPNGAQAPETEGHHAAWVAESHGRIVGHVALHERCLPPVMALAAQATGRPLEDLAVVARLLVAPSERRSGVGRSLLATAAGAAEARGRWPILDVATQFDGAIGLYESCGWSRAGLVTAHITIDGETLSLDLYVYLGPAPG